MTQEKSNNPMTGTIYLSSDDSAIIRQNILNSSEEYVRERSEFFEKIASSMVVQRTGTNSIVEFDGLDLSSLDDIIMEGEKNE